MTTNVAYIVFILELLLASYFFYTVVAIFKGAAPVPSRTSTVTRILKIANIKPGEILLDLGSGDGRIVFAAAKQGARSIGLEINPFLFAYSYLRAKISNKKEVCIKRTDFWAYNLSDVDILTVYLVPQFMPKLQEKALKEMRPGSRIIAAVYPFQNWPADEQDKNVFLYYIPEKESLTQKLT